MRLRHILEYEDHEIEGLLGDLETIGLSTKGAYSLWVAVPSFTFPSGVVGNLKLPLALGNPFWSNGSLREDRNLILSSLREGRFTRPPSFEKEHLALKKVDSDQEWEWASKSKENCGDCYSAFCW